MPDQAFSKISSLAGPELPARHQTLNDFLKLSTSLPFDRAAVVAAAEGNVDILKQCLAFVQVDGIDITGWHQQISDQTFRDLAIMLGNSALRRSGANSTSSHWQRARLAQFVARGLASEIHISDQAASRLQLLASLLNLGHQLLSVRDVGNPPRDQLLATEQIEFGITGDIAGSDWLLERGFARADSDVLRYQYEGIDQLVGAGDDLVLVALSGRVADAMLTNFELADQYYQVIEERLEIPSSKLPNVFERAYLALRAENDRLIADKDFESRLALANLGQQFSSCDNGATLLELAADCFGVNAICFAAHADDRLTVTYQTEVFNTPARSGLSALTHAFQSQNPFSAEESTLVAIVDKQILSRMAANVIWIVPLGTAGLAVCGANSLTDVTEPDAYLLAAFRAACVGLAEALNTTGPALIELGEVQAQVRELTHEVNNPLAIVQNYLKTLSLRLGTDNTAQKDIKTISDEMLRIGSIIQQYAQIGVESESRVRATNINALISDITGVIERGHENVKVTRDLDELVPTLQLATDELKQVLLNLMKNAVEAMGLDSDAHLHVRTLGRVNFGGSFFVEISIEDNGPGIPDEIYQKLFRENNSSKGPDHSGIGLSVAHRLIGEMGGFISCRSEGSGTQFQVLLPNNIT